MKILIVEDEPAIARALHTLFREEGFEVLAAKDGEEGMARALEHRPDIILFDIVMPRMDGIAMLRNIRERTRGDEWAARMKAVVYSNLSYFEKRREAEAVGIADFWVKANMRIDDLVRKVRELLEDRVEEEHPVREHA